MDDQPVTKKDLAEALADTKQEILASTKRDLAEAKQEILERTQEMIRDSQTKILRGFEVYAKASEARLKRLESGLVMLYSDDAAMNERLANLESRLLEIGQKLILRPPAAWSVSHAPSSPHQFSRIRGACIRS